MERQKQVRQDFIYPDIGQEERHYGANLFTRLIVNPTADWRKSLPPDEVQKRHNVEPSTCYLYAQTHSDATYEEFVYGQLDNDYAERFPAQFSKGTPQGGNPLKGSDAIYDNGSVKESSMPFDENIKSWEEYHTWKGVDKEKVLAEGRADKLKKARYGVMIFERNTPIETKYLLMEEASKRGVVSISLWGMPDGDTYAEKPAGIVDTHMVEAPYIDRKNKQIHIWDTVEPLYKILPKNYNPDFGMVRYVELREEQEAPNWLVDIVKKLYEAVVDIAKKILELKTEQLEKKTMKTLKEVVLESINQDASPANIAPQDLSCAESMSVLINSVYSDFPSDIISTAELFKALKKSPHFEATLDPNDGCVIISPRTETVNGHVGYINDGRIISNDSKTGTMAVNYLWNTWIKEFRDKRGLRIYLFKEKNERVA